SCVPWQGHQTTQGPGEDPLQREEAQQQCAGAVQDQGSGQKHTPRVCRGVEEHRRHLRRHPERRRQADADQGGEGLFVGRHPAERDRQPDFSCFSQ
ncbi:unnamed protein product, partial [Ectocarpus sp. 12 AP-2014]